MKNQISKLGRAFLPALLMAASAANAAPQTFFETWGPYGEEGLYDSSQYTIKLLQPYGDWVQPGVSTLSFSVLPKTGLQVPYYRFDISTLQLGHALQVGTYTDAERMAFATAGHPGLDLSGSGQGFNTLGGGFTIYDATFGASGKIESFAASFYIAVGDHATVIQSGKIWFNSEVSPSVPEPESLMLALFGAATCLVLAQSKMKSEKAGI